MDKDRALEIFNNYSHLAIAIPRIYLGEQYFKTYFNDEADAGKFDAEDEAIAYISKAHENHPDADDLTLAIMAFVAFYKFIDGDEIKDDEKAVVIMYWKDRIETVFNGTWGRLLEKYKI